MALWAIPLAMAVAGAAKGEMDRRAADKKRRAEGEIARWSPWTGMSAQRVSDGPGVLGGAMQGGASGLSMMQAAKEAGYGADSPSSTAAGTEAPTPAPAAAPAAPSYSLYGSQAAPQMQPMNLADLENSDIMQGAYYRPGARASMWTLK